MKRKKTKKKKKKIKKERKKKEDRQLNILVKSFNSFLCLLLF